MGFSRTIQQMFAAKRSVAIVISLVIILISGLLIMRHNTTTVGVNRQISSVDLNDPSKKDIAMQLVSSAENSSLDWKAQYGYIEWDVEHNDSENRGYTGGIIGFCSGCGDMTELLQAYDTLAPGNKLHSYIPALKVQEILGMGRVTQVGLGQTFVDDWKAAAKDVRFQQAQNNERDRVYFEPAVKQAKADGLHALGQFAYYDALVMHGPGDEPLSSGSIRALAMQRAKTPAQGGDETAYLNAYLDARIKVMKAEAGHSETSRVDTMQRKFLKEGNLDLTTPLQWQTYGDTYQITADPR